MHSLRLHNPDCAITLLTDDGTHANLTGFRATIKNYVNEVVIVDIPQDLSICKRSRYIKTSVRQHVSGDFMYIDCDTIITGRLDLDERDDMADLSAVISRHTNPWTRKNPYRLMTKVYLSRNIDPAGEPPIENYYNAGILYCRDTPKTHEFFNLWHSLWNEYQENHDQPDFWRADARLGNLIKAMDGIYNCQILYEGSRAYAEDCRVFHYFSSSFKHDWVPFKKTKFLKELRARGITPEVEEQIRNIKAEFLLRCNAERKETTGGSEKVPGQFRCTWNGIKKAMCSIPPFSWLWKIKCRIKPLNLEIHLADHCNLGCKSCCHYSPIAPEQQADPESVRTALAGLKARIGDSNIFSVIHLTGGEPFLNQRIDEIVQIVRETFTRLPVRIITNGLVLSTQPEKIPSGFWEACRECNVIIDITRYPVEIDIDNIKKLCRDHQVKCVTKRNVYSFGAFQFMRLLPGPFGRRMNYYKCTFRNSWQLRGDKLYACPQSAYSDFVNRRFNTDYKHQKGDYLNISSLSAWKIKKFRFLPKPFCRYCEFPRIPIKEWTPTRKAPNEWIAESNNNKHK